MAVRRVLEVLGAVRVMPDGRAVPAAGASLLAYLAVRGPDRIARQQVAFTLWPDRSEDRARRTLSDTIYRLRAVFDDDAPWLVADADGLELVDIDVDLWTFRSLADGETADDLPRAIAMHRGPLADGIDDEWVTLPRRAHHERVVALCEQACTTLPLADRLAIAERWAEIDPWATEPHRTLVTTLLALDRRDAARRTIDHYRSVLDDLGIDDPDIERWAAMATEAPPPAAPFVGRVAERGRLVRALDAACEGNGGGVIVLGEAGIGKTRLLEELVDAARWRGVDVVCGTCEEFAAPRPLAPLDHALTAAFDEVRIAQAPDALPADVLRALASIIPGLGDGGRSEMALSDSIGHALRWLGTIRPLLVVLDDAHWAGPDLWSTLVEVVPRLAESSVLVVIAARTAEVLAAGERASIGLLDAAGTPVVQLTGLTVAELDDLVRSLGRSDDGADLHARSGGNPLVAIGWAGDPLDGAFDGDDVVDGAGRVAAGVHARLRTVSDTTRDVIRQAAVLGRAVEYPILADAVGIDTAAVFDAVHELERGGLLHRADGRLTFEHDLVRRAVLDDTSTDARRELHRRALAAVERADPTDAARLLGHAEGAGDASSIVVASIAVGTDALDQSAYRTAEDHFDRALELVAAADDPLALHAALAGRIRARDRLADRAGQGADVARLVEHATAAGSQFLTEALQLEAEYRFITGDFDGTLATVERATGRRIDELTATVEVASPDDVPTEMLRIASMTLRELGRHAEATQLGEAARDRYAAASDTYGVALMTDVIAGIAWRTGQPGEAARLHRQSADMFASLGALGAEARALNNVGTALWAVGDDHGAEEVHERALDICRRLGDRRGEGDNLDNLGGVAFVRGDMATAIELYESALTIRRATDDPWGISISLSNLGDAFRALGRHREALESIEESLSVNRDAGVVRNEATTLQSRGLVLADLGRVDEALVELRTAADMHAELGDHANLVETHSAIVSVLVAAGADPRDVRAGIDALMARVTPTDPATVRQVAATTAAEALGSAVVADHDGARAAAGRAFAAMDEVLAPLDPVDAAHRRASVPLHRRTGALLDRFATVVEVDLVRADPSSDPSVGPDRHDTDDRVTVRWTVARPDDDAVEDVPTRRRVVLRRLLAEAAAAGGLPVDDQLAAACGVTRRTILRDIEVLRREGVSVATRGRRS